MFDEPLWSICVEAQCPLCRSGVIPLRHSCSSPARLSARGCRGLVADRPCHQSTTSLLVGVGGWVGGVSGAGATSSRPQDRLRRRCGRSPGSGRGRGRPYVTASLNDSKTQTKGARSRSRSITRAAFGRTAALHPSGMVAACARELVMALRGSVFPLPHLRLQERLAAAFGNGELRRGCQLPSGLPHRSAVVLACGRLTAPGCRKPPAVSCRNSLPFCRSRHR